MRALIKEILVAIFKNRNEHDLQILRLTAKEQERRLHLILASIIEIVFFLSLAYVGGYIGGGVVGVLTNPTHPFNSASWVNPPMPLAIRTFGMVVFLLFTFCGLFGGILLWVLTMRKTKFIGENAIMAILRTGPLW